MNFPQPRATARVPSFSSRARRAGLFLLLTALGICLLSGRAQARATGIAAEGCTGCHGGGKEPTVTLTPDLTTINPGATVNLTVSISPTNGNGAGFYLVASTGTLSIVEAGTKLAGAGVVHSATRRGTGGEIKFKVGWTAPASPGGVDIWAFGNSVNDNGNANGDGGGVAFYSTAFGCTGTKFYRDLDNDGVGSETFGYTVACSAPMGFSAKSSDCDENDAKIFTGAPEVCDGKDNNCDGKIDEGMPVQTFCTDADGDGHGVAGLPTIMGCGPSKGFGLCDGDCNDNDAAIHPGAAEICNNKDDDCNARVDENRPVCGLGWCARYAPSCNALCVAGAPRAEECNDFDDDCDGLSDNASDLQLCGKAGLTCVKGSCVASDGAAGGGASAGAGMGGRGGAGGEGSSRAGTSSSGGAGASSDPPLAAGSPAAPASEAPAAAGCGFGRRPSNAPLASWAVLLGLGIALRRRRVGGG